MSQPVDNPPQVPNFDQIVKGNVTITPFLISNAHY